MFSRSFGRIRARVSAVSTVAVARRQLATASIKLADPTLLKTECFINGKWVSSAKKSNVVNPATGETLCQIPVLGAAETRAAIDAANAALPAWSAKTSIERAAILRQFSALMNQHANDLSTILTSEQGKPLGEAKGEVGISSSYMEWFGEEGKRVYGDLIPGPAGTRIMTMKQPVGVVGMVTPWNFPSSMITRKAGAALAAGCTVVVKPSEATPLSAFVLAEIGVRAGLPAGVLNFVTGDVPAIGGELTANPIVRKISFTGSTRVGKLLMRQSSDTVKKVSMELGGNAPFIVFNDADLEKAAAGVILCKFRNAGQTCVSANRIFVQSKVYDEFTKILTAKVLAMNVGNGLHAGVNLGPLINTAAIAKVQAQLNDAVSKGGRVTCGGGAPDPKMGLSKGTFFMPTVITNARSDMECFSQETFGPLAPLFKFETDAEAIALANNTTAGLAAYFYTENGTRQWRVSEALEYGMVGVNTFTVSHAHAPFGGIKESGVGREGSKYGLDDYLIIKAVHIGGI